MNGQAEQRPGKGIAKLSHAARREGVAWQRNPGPRAATGLARQREAEQRLCAG